MYNGQYDADNSAPTWSSGLDCEISYKAADTAGTASDPLLTVTYTTPTGPAFLLGLV